MKTAHSYRRCLQLFVPLFAVVLAVVTSPALADGTARAWGNNGSGQCTIPSDLGVCTQIAGGDYHTIAIQYNNPCPTDITPPSGDGVVNGNDLAALLSSWATSGAGDINTDGIVDGADLMIMLSSWGNCP